MVTYAFLFPILIAICLLLRVRLLSCIQISTFPLFPCTVAVPLSGRTAVKSYGNLIDKCIMWASLTGLRNELNVRKGRVDALLKICCICLMWQTQYPYYNYLLFSESANIVHCCERYRLFCVCRMTIVFRVKCDNFKQNFSNSFLPTGFSFMERWLYL